MRGRWHRLIERARTGFWFMPMVMLAAACGLALLVLYIDERIDPGIKATLPWAYSGGPEGARSLLSTIAGSMITAASVTFSLASVALSIASQQYGSRVLRNFMRDRITQVLTNIIGNALAATPAEGTVTVEARAAGQRAEVSVTDTGAGLAAGDLERVFERFYRAPGQPRRSGGSGIGLTIARNIARAHGGEVTASSPGPGRGATFVLMLPLRTTPTP